MAKVQDLEKGVVNEVGFENSLWQKVLLVSSQITMREDASHTIAERMPLLGRMIRWRPYTKFREENAIFFWLRREQRPYTVLRVELRIWRPYTMRRREIAVSLQ